MDIGDTATHPYNGLYVLDMDGSRPDGAPLSMAGRERIRKHIEYGVLSRVKIREILEQVCGASDVTIAQEIIEALGMKVPGEYPHD